MPANKNGQVILKTNLFSKNVALLAGIAIENLEQTLGGSTPRTIELKKLMQQVVEGVSTEVKSCECYALALTEYPVVCAKHAGEYATSGSKFVIVSTCGEGHTHHWVSAYGVGQPVASMGQEDTLENAFAALDEIGTEEEFRAQMQRDRDAAELKRPALQSSAASVIDEAWDLSKMKFDKEKPN